MVFVVLPVMSKDARTLKDPEEADKANIEAKERLRRLKEERIRDRSERKEKQPVREFESPRVQHLWDVAQTKFDNVTEADTLAKLKKELAGINNLEVQLRDKENVDENSEEVHELRRRMKKFFHKYEQMQPLPMKLTPQNDSLLNDPKLKSLWSRVKHLDFLEDRDIEELQGEFLFCQDQIGASNHFASNDDLYMQLLEIGFIALSKALKEDDGSKDDLLQSVYAEFDFEMVNKALGAFMSIEKEVYMCYNRLEHYTNSTIRKEGFKEPVVNKLWTDAQKGNFTKSEMKHFRAELEQFQRRLRKQTNMERNSQQMEMRYSEKMRSGEKIPHPMRTDMAKQMRQMKEDNKNRKEELIQWYENLANKIRSPVGHFEL